MKKNPAVYYDSVAQGYNELHGDEQRAKYSLLAHELKLPTDATVLDVGAGTGIGNEYFPKALGIDPAKGLIAQHPNKSSLVGRAEQLPFPDKSFDAVLCVTALHHANVPQALAEMNRVSKQWIAITILKKSAQTPVLTAQIRSAFVVHKELTEAKDVLFIARRKD